PGQLPPGAPGGHGPFGPPPPGAPLSQQAVDQYMYGAWATPPPPQDALAVVSLVLGIVALLVLPLLGVPGLVLGLLGLRRIRAGRTRGMGLSVAGIVLGGIGTLLTFLVVLVLGMSLFGFLGEVVGL
ncbi:membrane protein, partial [Cellulomonas bogoriensis 69B4 = DSM 16987]